MKPYYSEDGITIYHGDCRDVLCGLPEESAHIVLTDIPYNASQDSHGLRNLDYGEWDHGFELSEFLPSLYRMMRGSIYIWCGNTQLSRLLVDFCEHDLLERTLAWVKNNPTIINGEKIWLPGIELCAFGKLPSTPFYQHCHPGVWHDSPDADRWHPCQKPLSIIAAQIKASSVDGELVLDPFMGSGTTLVAAKSLGRRAIGIEIEKRYCDIAIERLRQQTLDFSEPLDGCKIPVQEELYGASTVGGNKSKNLQGEQGKAENRKSKEAAQRDEETIIPRGQTQNTVEGN